MKSDENKDLTTNNLSGIHYVHTGDADFSVGTTTTTSTFTIQTQREVQDVKFIENEEGNFLEIIYKETQNYGGITTVIYAGYPMNCMVKERYGVVDGKMQLIKTIRGTESAGYYVPPSVEWEE